MSAKGGNRPFLTNKNAFNKIKSQLSIYDNLMLANELGLTETQLKRIINRQSSLPLEVLDKLYRLYDLYGISDITVLDVLGERYSAKVIQQRRQR